MISSRLGRSTESQILLSHNNITLALDDGKALGLILFDYTKAFSCSEPQHCAGQIGNTEYYKKNFALG